jgi:RNA polymerase sigma-70 factor (ECF subfamily)
LEDDALDLMAGVAAGDASALSALYDHHAAGVLGICLRILRDRAEAEEVLGDVFLEVWRRKERYDPSRGGVAAYLVTLARARALDRLRARARRLVREVGAAEDLAGAMATDPSPLEGAVARETRRQVLQAMEALSPEQRRTLELTFFDGLSHREVAAALGEPLGTIKARIRRGMLHLKERLQSMYEQGAVP